MVRPERTLEPVRAPKLLLGAAPAIRGARHGIATLMDTFRTGCILSVP